MPPIVTVELDQTQEGMQQISLAFPEELMSKVIEAASVPGHAAALRQALEPYTDQVKVCEAMARRPQVADHFNHIQLRGKVSKKVSCYHIKRDTLKTIRESADAYAQQPGIFICMLLEDWLFDQNKVTAH